MTELENNLKILSSRDKVNALEELMNDRPHDIMLNGQITDLKVEHFFSPGIYTRALFIPKGCLLTGKTHKEPILNIMLKGDLSVLLDGEIKRIKAPFICVSPAGSKKIGYAHEDTIWAGCHGTNETNIEKIEERFVAATEEEFLEYCNEQLRLPLFERQLKMV